MGEAGRYSEFWSTMGLDLFPNSVIYESILWFSMMASGSLAQCSTPGSLFIKLSDTYDKILKSGYSDYSACVLKSRIGRFLDLIPSSAGLVPKTRSTLY
jgi:hypothetical protein